MPIETGLPQPTGPPRPATDPPPQTVRTVYVSEQHSIDESGAVAGSDLRGQLALAVSNVEAVVARSGGNLGHVVSWSIAVIDGHDLRDGFAAVSEISGAAASAISALPVRSLGRPDLIVEVSAVAAIPA